MATDTKQQIELECQQVQEQLLKLTADRELLMKEFKQITSCSQLLLQQIHEDSSQASEVKKNKFEIEKEKLEAKLRALETDIAEKNKKIDYLDSKASDYLLQVSTFSNSLYDSPVVSATEDLRVQEDDSSNIPKEEVSNVTENISDPRVKCEDDVKPEPESLPEVTDSRDKSLNVQAKPIEVPDSEKNLNVEVKTVINLVMEDVPSVSKVANESVEISEACSKAILATNQVIENIQGQIERNDTTDIPVCEDEKNILSATSENESDVYAVSAKFEICDVNNEITIGKGLPEMPLDIKTDVEPDSMKVETVEEKPSGLIANGNEKVLPISSIVNMIETSENPSSQLIVTEADSSSNKEGGKHSNGNGSPVREQMMSLSLLVSELRRVKDDMGKCMSVKEHSFIELEDQLQAANKEVASLKVSMSHMSKNLEEKERSHQALEEENMKKKMDIELKMKDLQEVTNKCSMLSEEKAEILRKMEVLEIMMSEYRTEIEMLIAEKSKLEEDTKQLLSAKVATSVAEAEIDSRTDVEEKEREIEELVEKIQSMEKQMKELNDKLKVTNKHLKIMAREREHKQKECEVLKRKVELVELKMCELQGTFDMLVKAVMVERDELIKEMEEKNGLIDDVHCTLAQLKESHEQELEKVLHEKRVLQEELGKYKAGELKPVAMVDQKELETVALEKERLALELKVQTEQKDMLETKVKTIQGETNEFIGVLKDEMSRLKDETEKTKIEKKCLEETFSSLQTDHVEMTSKYQSLEKSFKELEQSNKEKTANLEVMKLQLDDLQQQLEDLNTKNFNLSSEMYSKEEEFREELSARERTIQELNVTLTNNQKQSMENYNALQDDLTNLQTKYETSTEENKNQLVELEDKLKQSQEDKKNEILQLQGKVKCLMEELKEVKNDAAESQTSCYQECESPSLSQDAELQSSSLAVAPSLPLDTVADSLSTSHSLPTEAECREVEFMKKREKELEELLKVKCLKLETKEAEVLKLVESDVPQLNEKIAQLSRELEEIKTNTPAKESFKSQAEFEIVIKEKEERIRDLESKVNDLELCLVNKNGYISQLEGRLDGKPEEKNDVEVHLQQIRALSSDITKLKDELRETHRKCQDLEQTVNQLEKDKEGLELKNTKLMEEYESKLQGASSDLLEVQANLEEKKKLG